MTSYADELLADLGSDGSGSERAESPGLGEASNGGGADAGMTGGDDDDAGEEAGMDLDGAEPLGAGAVLLNKNAVRPAQEMQASDVETMDLLSVDSVRSVSKLRESSKMKECMSAIDHYSALEAPDIAGVLEESPEYQLIVKSNNLAVDVDNEILIVHKYIRDHYAPRFPELETLILNPWEFVRAVQALGNDEDLRKANLESILPHGTVVVISMTASTTRGQPLPKDEWAKVQEAAELVFDLEASRRKILEYVESRMNLIAPNLSAVVGTRVATKLLGIAGGLTGLSKIPACNMHLLGASRKGIAGMSSSFANRPTGFIFQCDLIQQTSEDYHRQAQRIVSAKALLAARVDMGGSDRFGTYGAKLRQELNKKLEKLQEPPPSKMTKALPVPQEGGKKQRRGGRRARKIKEMNGMTELKKQQNRVQFGQAEEEAGAFDETIGLGMMTSSNNGRVRAQVPGEKNKAKMSKKTQGRLEALRGRIAGGALDAGGDSSGTASSLSFTPVQGIELVDPSRQRKVDEANAKWFKEGTFSLAPGARGNNLIPGSSVAPGGSSMGPPMAPPPAKKPRIE